MHIGLWTEVFYWTSLTLLISFGVQHFCKQRRPQVRHRHPPIFRRATSAKPLPIKCQRKPGWVITEVLRLLAITRGQMGCRGVAALFNARFAFKGESVSKSYVAVLRKKHRYAILQLRKQLRQPPKPGKPNQTWALDWTNVTINKETHILLGVIDHGSRRLLALKFADKSAAHVIKLLRQLIEKFGKPKSIRTDNDGAFVSIYFALVMQKMRIKHQRSAPHQPWQNGRIERFFGTFKRAIRQIEITSRAQLQQAVTEFSFFYNHIRQHQNLGYRTPNMAWNGQTEFPKRKTPRWFAAWDGVLCGWYWGDVKKPPDD